MYRVLLLKQVTSTTGYPSGSRAKSAKLRIRGFESLPGHQHFCLKIQYFLGEPCKVCGFFSIFEKSSIIMKKESKLKVRSIIPYGGWKRALNAAVKSRRH